MLIGARFIVGAVHFHQIGPYIKYRGGLFFAGMLVTCRIGLMQGVKLSPVSRVAARFKEKHRIVASFFQTCLNKIPDQFGIAAMPLMMTILSKPFRAISSQVASSRSHTTRSGKAKAPG